LDHERVTSVWVSPGAGHPLIGLIVVVVVVVVGAQEQWTW
jgi:hypothetical protein